MTVLWQGTQMSDGATYTPADPSRFSIGFHADGRFNLRADCNVGNGRYQVDGDQLSLTPLALTRAACPPESLDSDYLRQLGQVSRYYLLGDDLILEFPVDSGTMRFSRVVGE